MEEEAVVAVVVGDIVVHPQCDGDLAQEQVRHIHGGERLTGLAAFPETALACSRLPTGAADRVKARPRFMATGADGRNHAMVPAGAGTNLVASCFSSWVRSYRRPPTPATLQEGGFDGVDG